MTIHRKIELVLQMPLMTGLYLVQSPLIIRIFRSIFHRPRRLLLRQVSFLVSLDLRLQILAQ